MSNDYQVSQEKEDNDKECSECGGEPYPKVWWRTVSNSPDYNTASPDITNMNEELTSEIVEKIIPIIEKYLAQAQQEAVENYKKSLYQTADEWDSEIPVINPLNNEIIKGAKNPRATSFLRELMARNEALQKGDK